MILHFISPMLGLTQFTYIYIYIHTHTHIYIYVYITYIYILYSPWNSPGQNTGVGSHSFLQGIFPTQGLNPGLPHCSQILYQPSHKGSPCYIYVIYIYNIIIYVYIIMLPLLKTL